MIDPGTPASRGTDWLSLDVPQIWAMVADHETEAHQRVVSGWRKTAELSQLHLHRLQAYRRELAATWSPTGSAAAREYLDRLDFLIDTIRRTHDTASANYTTFAAATSAIGQSRLDLQQVYEDYTAKAQIRLDYDRVLQERKAMGGGEILNSTPPVSDQELQQLRGRARLIMYGLSSELRQAQTQIQNPPIYERQNRAKASGNPEASDSSEVWPLTAAFASAATGSAVAPSVSATPPMNYMPGSGPVLGSAGPVAPAPSIPATNPPVTGQPTPPGIGGGGPVAPVMPPLDRTGRHQPPLSRPGGAGSVSERLSPGRPVAGGVPGGRPSMAPGGIIGGTAGTGAASPERKNRINPVGGVIGGAGGTATTPSGRGSAHGQSLIGPTAGHPSSRARGTREQRDGEQKPWDPDQPWETNQGVEPILLPPAATDRFDPGPAIGHLR